MSQSNFKYTGFFGFFGFMGFSYFSTGQVSSLFWFSFFAFFSYFLLAKLAAEMPDERLMENSRRAKTVSAMIPLTTVFIVGFCAGLPFASPELTTIVCALGWAATFIVYALLFIYYEKH